MLLFGFGGGGFFSFLFGGGGLFNFFAFAGRGNGGNFAHLFLEFLDAAGGVNKFLFAGIKRVALAAELDAYFFHGAAGGKSIAAGAGYLGVGIVLRVDILFHITYGSTESTELRKVRKRFVCLYLSIFVFFVP